MDRDTLQEILKRYAEGKATPEERWFLEEYYRLFDRRKDRQVRPPADELPAWEEEVLDRIHAALPSVARGRRRRRWPIAAAVVLLLALGFYLLYRSRAPVSSVPVPATVAGQDIRPPQTARAVLTLANGQNVFLDSARNGGLAVQGNTSITKPSNSQIDYKPGTHSAAGPVLYNTLTVPAGSRIFTLTLSDGTRVWLNAASSLRYPTCFTDKERTVELNGEAYFEVAENRAAPFKVSKGNVEILVLGTHFNVKAYDDEKAIKVTLLKGAVNVSRLAAAGRQQVTMKPGQQAQLGENPSATGSIRVKSGVNMDAVMAWKNGMFSFDKSDIKTIMNEVARWYNVDVIYSGTVTERFHVEMSRDTRVSDVFRILEATGGVHFSIEGRHIIVAPGTIGS